MNTNLRVGRFSQSLLAILFVAGALAACTTQEAKTDGGGGKGGGSGGTLGTGGTGGGSGGTGGAGGAADGGLVTSDGVLCPLPAHPLITDFTYVAADGGAMDFLHFGDATTLAGGEFAYPTMLQNPTYPVTSNITGSNWHISGTLGDFSGFGLFFDNCSRVDASAYRGISFTISGSVALGNMITMGVGTLNNVIAASWLNSHGGTATVGAPGRCLPTSGTNQYNQPTCADATKTIPVTTAPTTVTVLWTDLAGGKPEPNVTAGDITSIYWFFPPPTGAGTATPTTYAADIVIDDLSFVQ